MNKKNLLIVLLAMATVGIMATGCSGTEDAEPEYVDNPADAPPADAPVKPGGSGAAKGATRGSKGQ